MPGDAVSDRAPDVLWKAGRQRGLQAGYRACRRVGELHHFIESPIDPWKFFACPSGAASSQNAS